MEEWDCTKLQVCVFCFGARHLDYFVSPISFHKFSASESVFIQFENLKFLKHAACAVIIWIEFATNMVFVYIAK